MEGARQPGPLRPTTYTYKNSQTFGTLPGHRLAEAIDFLDKQPLALLEGEH